MTKSKININNDGQKILDSKDIADCFDKYFVNLGPIQASKINSNGSDNLQFLSNPCDKSFFFMPTNCLEMLNIVNSLKISYSCSHDEMSTHFLKQIAGSIVTPLVQICNLSLTTGVFPDSLKIAKVIPIYKKDDPSLVSNYRPVSILPSTSKFLERLTYHRLYDFLTKNELLHENQYGFRKFHSTELALLQLFDRVSNTLANHKHLIGVFMNLSKAFDTLDHTILIRKLEYYMD